MAWALRAFGLVSASLLSLGVATGQQQAGVTAWGTVPVLTVKQPDGRGKMNPAIHAEVRSAQDFPWWVERHTTKMAEAKARAGNVDLLFVGDSITQNYELTGPEPDRVFSPIWNELFRSHRAMNLGFGGDTTGQVLWRLAHGEVDGLAPKNIVLLIGTNNTYSGEGPVDTTAGVVAVVEDLHRRMPGAKITLIEILPSGISEEKSAADARVNASLRGRFKGSAYVSMLDLSALFLKGRKLDLDLFYDPYVTPPGLPLHPNSVGQRRMAEAVAKALYP